MHRTYQCKRRQPSGCCYRRYVQLDISPGHVGVVAPSTDDFCEVRRAQRCGLAVRLLPRLLLLLLLRLGSCLRLFPLHTSSWWQSSELSPCPGPWRQQIGHQLTALHRSDWPFAPAPCSCRQMLPLTLIVVPRVLTARSQHAITAANVAARMGRADWMEPQHSSRPCGRTRMHRHPRAALLEQQLCP